jgi:hypothetical protein
MSPDAVNEIFSHFCYVILRISTEIKKKIAQNLGFLVLGHLGVRFLQDNQK